MQVHVQYKSEMCIYGGYYLQNMAYLDHSFTQIGAPSYLLPLPYTQHQLETLSSPKITRVRMTSVCVMDRRFVCWRLKIMDDWVDIFQVL